MTPYEVDITQAAEQASVTASAALGNTIVLDGTSNQLVLRIDDTTSSTITLAEGTYTQQSLSRELQNRINSTVSSSGRTVSVSFLNQKLVIKSDRFGAASEVSVVSGTALPVIGFSGTETDRGLDVAGKFLVNGVVETATGVGRILTGAASNANTADLVVQVTLTSSQVLAGTDATLSVTHGLASRLDNLLENILDPVSGRLKAISDRFRRNVDDARASTLKENKLLDERRAVLVSQFANMEQTLNRLKSSGDFATNSLSSLISGRSR